MSKTNYEIKPGSQQVVMTRDFDAPRELVFQVMNDPELLGQWWGPAVYSTEVVEMEPRDGGSWRFVQRDDKGNEFPFHGVYHLVDAPNQVVQTFEFDGLPERHVIMETLVLTEKGGVTTMTQTSVFQSTADRDGMVASGMTDGSSEAMERLDLLVAARK